MPRILQNWWKRTKGGSRKRNNPGAGWRLVHGPEGWLVLSRPFPLPSDPDPLELHADWAGPVKLVTLAGRTEQRVEFFLGRSDAGANDPELDPEAADAREALIEELATRAVQSGKAESVAEWMPPTAFTLAGWLTAAGRETTLDREENLRLTLRRPGCDGQLRIERSQGRLRFVLPLGDWSDLPPIAACAMRMLAAAVNAQTRLVRIAWLPSGTRVRCEAQVDLSGLPLPAADRPWRESLWSQTVGLAARSLELALRHLALELSVLADAHYVDLAERLAARDRQK